MPIPTETTPLQARFTKGDLVEVDISDAAEVEKCFGRLDDGVAVFVRGTLAVGDRVRAEVYKIKTRFLEARLVEVTAPAPCRVQPTCSHFGICGGCKWQHVTYEEQLRIKHKQVADALAHLGGFEAVEVRDVLPAARQFGYRNKVDFSFSNKRFLLPEEIDVPTEELAKPEDFALGFHAPQRYAKAIDIDYCYLATPEMNRVLAAVRRFCLERGLSVYSTRTHEGFLRNLVVRQSEATAEVMVNLVTSSHDATLMADLAKALQEAVRSAPLTVVNNVTDRKNLVAFGDVEYVACGSGTITEKLGDLVFTISPNSFFQTHTAQTVALYEEIRKAARLDPADLLYDLYCGTGSISLTLAGACRQVVGIEVIESAISDARANAGHNHVDNVSFHSLDLKNLGPFLEEAGEEGRPDVVVTDPPRAGMHPKTIKTLRAVQPGRIIYVSCKPASLARDAAALCEGGVYTLQTVQPVDMFPHTNHIESVAVLDSGAE